jgi:acyl-homoserine-lactone acylase
MKSLLLAMAVGPAWAAAPPLPHLADLPVATDRPLSAEIVRTEYGIPHIRGASLKDAAFGVGYSAAEDNVCLLADQFVRINSRRSEVFGADPDNPADPNLVSDFGLLALGIRARADRLWPGLSARARALIEGYVEGYNRYLRRTPVQNLPAPCRNPATARPVTAQDLLAYLLLISQETSGAAFLEAAYAAAPPGGAMGRTAAIGPRAKLDLGSNAVAVGRELAGDGALLLGQPHFPYYGHLRFHEYHVEIPGHLNARGVSLLGFPVLNIGFNRNVAWSHTVAASEHFVVYRLDLDPADPTRYRLDRSPVPMEARTVKIPVRQQDGTSVEVERTVYRSRFGVLIVVPGQLDWDRRHAYALADANEDNPDLVDVWLGLAAARSVPEIKAVLAAHRGIPWVNTLAADGAGRVFYADASRVPALPRTAERAAQRSPELQALAERMGLLVLPGNTAEAAPPPGDAGLVDFERAPQLERLDYVANFNQPPWLINPARPLAGFPALYGPAREPLSLRARRGFALLEEARRRGRPVGLDELRRMAFDNEAQLAALVLSDLLKFCRDAPARQDCAALRSWDGQFEAGSRAALLFREFALRFQEMPAFARDYSPQSPLSTPHGLNPARKMFILKCLAEAAATLAEAGIPLDAPLGEVQFAPYFDAGGRTATRPWHGGDDAVGTLNVAGEGLRDGGTRLPEAVLPPETGLGRQGRQIRYGTSYIQAVRLGPSGAEGYGLLTYSQSSHWDSPHHADQAELYARKELRPLSLDWPKTGYLDRKVVE